MIQNPSKNCHLTPSHTEAWTGLLWHWDNQIRQKRRRQMEKISHHPIIWSAAQTREAFQWYLRHFWRRSQRCSNSYYISFLPSFLPMWREWMLSSAVSAGESEWETHTLTHTQMRLCVAEAVILNWSSDMEKWDIFLAHSCSLWEQHASSPEEQSLEKSSWTAARRPRRRSWFSRAGALRETHLETCITLKWSAHSYSPKENYIKHEPERG